MSADEVMTKIPSTPFIGTEVHYFPVIMAGFSRMILVNCSERARRPNCRS